MSADERRAHIVAAVTPLLLDRGAEVSTREIAEAAGVAEGTIFKVFANKDAVIHAVLRRLMDPAEDLAHLEDWQPINLTDTVRTLLHDMQQRIRQISAVMSLLNGRHPHPDEDEHDEAQREHREATERLLLAVDARFEPFADQLRVPVRTATVLIRAAAFASAHPMLSAGAESDPDLLTDVLLHGLTHPTTVTREETSC